ncbi:sensor histidine kinase [Nocardiopsis sp. MG754419]|uniref:sensor histidine kinase n=1 Tax=Nocardiopsis sp. MG754419 TaxID=2259865 RepID=UPI001BA7EDF8|nr:histidine kinase [Nocardiopsis sp. MG754419]MBR8741060.1 sensor histidine kinase [Nocardiopsis sp. MG754419]
MPEKPESTPGRLRAVNVGVVSASLSAVGTPLVVNDTEVWWQALWLASGLVAALFTVSRSTTDDRLAPLLPGLAYNVLVWVSAVLLYGMTSAAFALAIMGTLVVGRLSRHRRAVIAALVALVVAVLLAEPLVSDVTPAQFLQGAVSAAAVSIAGIVLVSLIEVVTQLVTEMERARQREAELAVARERVRFAGDLHDIQGHTLHVVKLKVALARKLLEGDAERADRELGEVYELVGDTIARTKDLAHAQRRLNLSAELENARNLFEAAGIEVSVDRREEADPHAGEMLGQVLRETTTNILRHAQAEHVRITLSERGITISNDGARSEPVTELRGLATLRERVSDQGGELTVEHSGGDFLTAVTFHSPTTPVTAP